MVRNLLAVVCCFATAMTAVQAATYSEKYDNINLDAILSNDRLFKTYFKCFMDTGKCTPEAEEIKRLIPDVIETKCSKCTEKQKIGSEKIIRFMYEKKNDMWKQIQDKYDPRGIYRQRYQEEAKKLNIKV